MKYIDWAADQGALSLAYEVAANFDSDQAIDSAISKALTDFGIVFHEGLPIGS